jgi:hypothetical protein
MAQYLQSNTVYSHQCIIHNQKSFSHLINLRHLQSLTITFFRMRAFIRFLYFKTFLFTLLLFETTTIRSQNHSMIQCPLSLLRTETQLSHNHHIHVWFSFHNCGLTKQNAAQHCMTMMTIR